MNNFQTMFKYILFKELTNISKDYCMTKAVVSIPDPRLDRLATPGLGCQRLVEMIYFQMRTGIPSPSSSENSFFAIQILRLR